ncbi:MAG: Type 1 glutamine amidotransferase-like domain-containing protein, partial [Halobacteriovoraceae bacterium]|nr:Type 1 glutamine amidotransferase-like domain-containing protein [Halobacteriovoraceae bacterium]
MKLVFYSGGGEEENYELDKECLSLLDNQNPTLCFIPSSSYDGEYEFHHFVEQYQMFGITRFLYFPIDVPQDKVLLGEIFNADLIHLGGGNTYYFLNCMRRIGFMNFLKEYALSGGVLTGLSAGGILMTPNVNTAGYPSFDCDDNEDGVTNFRAMNLVKFEFFPHYRNSVRYDTVLRKQS